MISLVKGCRTNKSQSSRWQKMAERMCRTPFSLVLLALCCVLLLALLPPVVSQEDSDSTVPPRSGQHANSSEESHEEEKDKCEEREEVMFDSTVRVARFEFHRVQTIFIILVFIMVVVLAKMIWHHRLMHIVASNIPESCMLIVVGAHIGGIIIGSFRLDPCNEGLEPPFRFTPDLFFLFLLPPIVLEAGYFIDSKAFFNNITTILMYAVIGTLWNTFAIGLTLYAIAESGQTIFTADNLKGAQFTIASAFLFGTICAAVDPVAVLAVFEDIHVNKLLHILVFGESLLNDAVTIVLFKVLGAFSHRPFDSSLGNSQRDITVEDAFIGIAQFFVVVLASLVIGVLTGMVASFISRFTAHVHVLEPMIIFVMGYLSYVLADMFEFSGIVSLIFCAMVMRHYIEPNLSRKSSTTTKYALKVVSNVSEMIIFLFLGISLYDTSVQNWDYGLSLWTIFFAALYRPIGVIALTLIVNIFRDKRIGYKSVFVMSYSGLRGAVAFSLALSRVNAEDSLTDPNASDDIKAEAALRKTMFTAVTVLVLFTVFVQGITIKPLVKMIKVRTATDKKPSMNEVIHGATIDHMMSGIEGILGYFGHNRLSEKLLLIDQKYLRKIFERYPEAGDEKILHTFKRLQQKESKQAVEKNLVFEYHGDDGKSESHISLHPDTDFFNGETEENTNIEDSLPSLNDILAASFAHPHEDHFGHVLAVHDREFAEDHHFEPVNYRRDIIRTKHATRKNRRRRRKKLRNLMQAASNASLDSSRPDKMDSQSYVEETDDVPDVPIPINEFPDDYSLKEPDDRVVSIPMETYTPLTDHAPQKGEEDSDKSQVPLSPRVIVTSKHTSV